MSEGNSRTDKIMAPLMGLDAKHYNRIYEAVMVLEDSTAYKLVGTIEELLREEPTYD